MREHAPHLTGRLPETHTIDTPQSACTRVGDTRAPRPCDTTVDGEFEAVEAADERRNACDGCAGRANLSLRTVFAVGFTDPVVMDLH
jgi:hypothetical protein